MKNDRKTTAEATANPKLWRCYWGQFEAKRNADTITPMIYANRDALAIRYGLTETRASLPNDINNLANYPCEDFDHPELYRTRDGGLLLLCSNYGGKPPITLGMVETAAIYSTSCKSYLRAFEGVKELRAVVKQATKGGQR